MKKSNKNKEFTPMEVALELKKALYKAAFSYIQKQKTLTNKIVEDIEDPNNKAQVLDTKNKSATKQSVVQKNTDISGKKVREEMESRAKESFSVTQPTADAVGRKAYNVRRKLAPKKRTKPQRPQVKSVKRIKGVKRLRTFIDNKKNKKS